MERVKPRGGHNFTVLVPTLYRAAAWGVACGQMLLLPAGNRIFLPSAVLLSISGVYTIFKVIHPKSWYRAGRPGYCLYGIDVVFCLLLVLVTGGLHSPFIFYSLSPVLISAIFLGVRATSIIAAATVAGVLGTQLGNPFFAVSFDATEINFFMVYLVALSLTSILPYLINVNLRQHLLYENILGERRRLAREIHDTTAQTLVSLRWKTQLAKRQAESGGMDLPQLDEMSELLESAYHDVCDTMDLLSAFSTGGSFTLWLHTYLKGLKENYGIEGRVDISAELDGLDAAAKMEFLRICQEALTNVRKHSGASSVSVSLRPVGDRLEMSITDNGHGFDASSRSPGDRVDGGRGLVVMKERAELIGGRFQVISAPGQGTEVRVWLPQKHKGGWFR